MYLLPQVTGMLYTAVSTIQGYVFKKMKTFASDTERLLGEEQKEVEM